MLQSFFSPQDCALKICGVTTAADAHGLIDAGVAALGVNFWPLSKRFISPDDASPWLHDCSGKILRVGVFVNAEVDYMIELYQQGLIDVVQMHGDEGPANLQKVLDCGIPCIKALGVNDAANLAVMDEYSAASAILLDTAAPGIYGGTGATFDWSLAIEAKLRHPHKPILLAGGITPTNASEAIAKVRPAAIDIASGAESAPGVKDFVKVKALQQAVSSR